MPTLSSFAGLPSGPVIMGILNVTPDSFSDGGHFLEPTAALTQARQMLAAGAHIIDVGGESTRPGAAVVSEEEELVRVLPVIEALSSEDVCLSIDTSKPAVMAAAVAAGASIINDVNALQAEGALETVARLQVPVILMHKQGNPATMQEQPSYGDVVAEVYQFLSQRIQAAQTAGIAPENLAVDVGVGFGKTTEHNVALLQALETFQDLAAAQVIGLSRKRFIEALDQPCPPTERVAGSLAAALHALQKGIKILRVHDVAATRQAVRVWQALQG